MARAQGRNAAFDSHDPEDVERLCRLIEVDGLTPVSAAEALGVPKQTFYGWVGASPALAARLKAAQAQLKLTLSRRVIEASKTQWQAGMTVLERLFPEEYGRRDRVQHEHAGQVGVQFIPAQMDAASILLAAELEERLSLAEDEKLMLPPHEDDEKI